MKVHHLDCGPMQPRVVGRLVCHVLLLETPAGLVLVDSGMGLQDVRDPSRLGPARGLLRVRLDERATALRQVEALGFRADDVRHVVLTHLDLDHVGGIADFSHAVVHTTAEEHAAATAPPSRREAFRYRAVQWAHGPRWSAPEPGEPWHGLRALPLPGLDDAVALVPMPGHTRGHAAVAVDTGSGWLLHAGDAVFHRHSLDPSQPSGRTLRAYEKGLALDPGAVAANHARLRALQGEGVVVVPAHDPVVFDRLAAG